MPVVMALCQNMICYYSRTMSMDYTKPLIVPAGSDALGQIGEYVREFEVTWCGACSLICTAGAPSLSAGDLAKINAKSVLPLPPNPSVCVCICAETPWSYGSRRTVDSSHRYIYICHLAVSRSNLCDQVAVKEEGGDPCRDINYLEPDIDSVRALKDEVSTQ